MPTEQQPELLSISDLLSPSAMLELKRLELRARRQVDTELSGAFRSAFKGSGLTFADFREYQPGDDIRSIHWRATARTGRVYVKDYEEERQSTFLIVLDVSRSTWFSGTDSVRQKLCEFAALLALLARKNHDLLGLMLFDVQVQKFIKPAAATRSHYQQILQHMLTFHSDSSETNVALALSECLKLQKRKAVVLLLSDLHSPDFLNELKLLSLKHEVICLNCRHPFEVEPPPVGLIRFKDAETGELVTFDSKSHSSRSQLKRKCTENISKLEKQIRSNGADYVNFVESGLVSLRNLIRLRKMRR